MVYLFLSIFNRLVFPSNLQKIYIILEVSKYK